MMDEQKIPICYVSRIVEIQQIGNCENSFDKWLEISEAMRYKSIRCDDVFKQYKAHYLTFFHSNLIRKPQTSDFFLDSLSQMYKTRFMQKRIFM